MSGGKISLVTRIPRLLNPFSTETSSLSTIADSPETCEEPEGLVTLPGTETDFPIKDIPIVREGEDMLYMKAVTPSVNIVPSYLTSTCSSPDTSSLEATCPPTAREFDHMYASLSKADTNVLMAENVHLREMLVSQLDLIQQQSETILSKDKQLKVLREENGLLVQRLSRMERRCRGEGGSSGSSVDRKQPGISQGGIKKRSRDNDAGATPESSVKKKKVDNSNHAWPDQSLSSSKECVDSFGPREDELYDEIMGDMLDNSRPDTPASVASVDTVKSDQVNKPTGKKSKKNSLEGKRKSLPSSSKTSADSSLAEKEPKFKKVRTQTSVETFHPHETNELYYVGCKNDILPNTDDHLDEVAVLQRGVEVPTYREDKNHYNLIVPNKLCIKKDKAKETANTWRIKSTNPIYSGEGPGDEDISDQTMLKRHEKFEKDEKQRKRWDAQRLREELQLQRLRARQEKQILGVSGTTSKRDDTISLLPNIESATYVYVNDKIPVSAFGRPLPSLPQTSFLLPWMKSRH